MRGLVQHLSLPGAETSVLAQGKQEIQSLAAEFRTVIVEQTKFSAPASSMLALVLGIATGVCYLLGFVFYNATAVDRYCACCYRNCAGKPLF